MRKREWPATSSGQPSVESLLSLFGISFRRLSVETAEEPAVVAFSELGSFCADTPHMASGGKQLAQPGQFDCSIMRHDRGIWRLSDWCCDLGVRNNTQSEACNSSC